MWEEGETKQTHGIFLFVHLFSRQMMQLKKVVDMDGSATRMVSNLLKLFEDDDRKHPRLIRILDYLEKKREVDDEQKQNCDGTSEQQKKGEDTIAKLYKDK
jgi:hypothetical protein